MVAAVEPRMTKQRMDEVYSRPVAANVKILEGTIVCRTAAGYATPAVTALALQSDGIARTTVDNTGGAAGAKRVEIDKRVAHFANSAAGDLITIAEVGDTAFLVDNQTVAKTDGAGTRSAAGTIVDLDATGVWIKFA